MLRKLLFVGMILVLMASFTVVLADQDGHDLWCNSDQYGCWVTNEEGGQDYIMFWSEAARELFMGPGSNAVVADPFPAGKMTLQPAPVQKSGFAAKLDAYIAWLISTGMDTDEEDLKGTREYFERTQDEERLDAVWETFKESYEAQNKAATEQKMSQLADLMWDYWNSTNSSQLNYFDSKDALVEEIKKSYDDFDNGTATAYSSGDEYLNDQISQLQRMGEKQNTNTSTEENTNTATEENTNTSTETTTNTSTEANTNTSTDDASSQHGKVDYTTLEGETLYFDTEEDFLAYIAEKDGKDRCWFEPYDEDSSIVVCE